VSAKRVAALAALAVAFVLRAWSLGFGLPFNTQPDEVFLDYFVLYTVGHRFEYYYPFYDNLQTLVLAICHGAVFAWQRLSGAVTSPMGYLVAHLRDPSPLVLCGRALSALESTAGVAAAGLLAARIARPGAFPVAAAFAAVAANSVQDGHYMKGHVLTATLMTGAMVAVLDVRVKTDNRVVYLAVGLIALACASKFYAGVVALPLALALATGPRRELRTLALAALAGAAVYLAASPGLVLHPVSAIQRAGMLREEVGKSYIETGGQPLALFYWTVCLPWSLGVPLYLLGLAGLARGLARREPWAALVAVYAGGYTAALSASTGFFRYAIPLELALAATAAAAALALTDRLPVAARRPALALVVAVAALPPLVRAVAFDRYIGAPDTRAEAAAWIDAHVPEGASVAVEGMEGPFLVSLVGPQVPPPRARLERELTAARGQAAGRLLSALAEAVAKRKQLDVTTVVRLDEAPRTGADYRDARVWLDRGTRYLVSSGWVPRRRVPEGRYESAFQADLDAHYEVVATFEPHPEFRWDAIGWLVDYERLAQALSAEPVKQGPRILVYHRRGAP